MEIHHTFNGAPLLTLTTAEEVDVVSLVANNNWAKYPTIFHPFKRSVHRNLARRAFEGAHRTGDIVQPFPLTSKETAIVAKGIPSLENAVLEANETLQSRQDAAALCLAEALRKLSTTE